MRPDNGAVFYFLHAIAASHRITPHIALFPHAYPLNQQRDIDALTQVNDDGPHHIEASDVCSWRKDVGPGPLGPISCGRKLSIESLSRSQNRIETS